MEASQYLHHPDWPIAKKGASRASGGMLQDRSVAQCGTCPPCNLARGGGLQVVALLQDLDQALVNDPRSVSRGGGRAHWTISFVQSCLTVYVQIGPKSQCFKNLTPNFCIGVKTFLTLH